MYDCQNIQLKKKACSLSAYLTVFILNFLFIETVSWAGGKRAWGGGGAQEIVSYNANFQHGYAIRI